MTKPQNKNQTWGRNPKTKTKTDQTWPNSHTLLFQSSRKVRQTFHIYIRTVSSRRVRQHLQKHQANCACACACACVCMSASTATVVRWRFNGLANAFIMHVNCLLKAFHNLFTRISKAFQIYFKGLSNVIQWQFKAFLMHFKGLLKAF